MMMVLCWNYVVAKLGVAHCPTPCPASACRAPLHKFNYKLLVRVEQHGADKVQGDCRSPKYVLHLIAKTTRWQRIPAKKCPQTSRWKRRCKNGFSVGLCIEQTQNHESGFKLISPFHKLQFLYGC